MKRTVTKPLTLMEFLSEIYPDSPRTRLKKLLQGGTLRVNDRPVSYFAYPLKPGDTVEINKQAGRAARAGLPFPVLYEDNEIIVIDKPPGRPTSSIDGSLSMQEIVSDYLVRQTKGKYQAHIVHRLDKEVSGVLLMAKSAEAMAVLKNSWKMTEKHYYALVEGVPEKKEDTIRSWLEETAKQKVQSAGNRENAKLAVTHYKVIKAFGDHSLLDIRTDTGRKNQIRVHLSEMGHPIIGDRKYGASAEFVRRVRLHAYSIAFPHPSTGRLLTIKSPMPAGYLSLKPKDEKYKP